MAAHSDHAWHQSSHRFTLLVMRWKSLASTPLAINLGAQLSMALCTRSSLAMCLSFRVIEDTIYRVPTALHKNAVLPMFEAYDTVGKANQIIMKIGIECAK